MLHHLLFIDLFHLHWGIALHSSKLIWTSLKEIILSQKASLVSAHPVVRDMLLDMQRDVARKHNVIMDGRDIGTVVLPKATLKIFLTATPEVRAKRRTDELLAKGQKVNFEQVLKDIQQRDYQDTNRPVAPLKQAKDAYLLDTSELDIEGVIAAMKKLVGEKIPV